MSLLFDDTILVYVSSKSFSLHLQYLDGGKVKEYGVHWAMCETKDIILSILLLIISSMFAKATHTNLFKIPPLHMSRST